MILPLWLLLMLFEVYRQGTDVIATNCALPQPFLSGIQNATAAQYPFEIQLHSDVSVHTENKYFLAVIHNGRHFEWKKPFIIKIPGRHSILATTVDLTTNCSRTDVFVFHAFSNIESIDERDSHAEIACGKPEFHQIILWSSVSAVNVQKLATLLSSLSSIVNYPDAKYHLRLLKLLYVDPIDKVFQEEWFQHFYGDTDYGIYSNSPEKVDMVAVKGNGLFHVAILQDVCPKYAFDVNRKSFLNVNLLSIKNILRIHSARWYQIHATLDAKESDDNYKLLFGLQAKEFVQSVLQSDGDESLPIPTYVVYVAQWNRALIPAMAMEVISVVMQSEWYRFETDLPGLHNEIGRRIAEPNIKNDMENIHRIAFLGVSRLALLAHLPVDTQWYKGVVTLDELASFHILKENGWHKEIPRCSTVKEAWEFISKATSNAANGSHTALIHRLRDAKTSFDKVIVAVGASINGPFTIWDGNHRAIALISQAQEKKPIKVYIGLSQAFLTPYRGSFYCE